MVERLTFEWVMALLTRREQECVSSFVHHDVQRVLQRLDQRQRALSLRERMCLFLTAPERVRLRLSKSRERKHAPVRRAGRVVRLGEVVVRVRVADVEHAVGLEDVVVLAPPPQVAKKQAFGHAPSQRSWWLDVCEREGAPEADCGETVGHAAAEGNRVAVGILVVDEVQSESSCTVAILFCSLGIRVVG